MKKILEENKKRRAKLFSHYDPFTGEGSPIPRFPLKIFKEQSKPVLLPESMKDIEYITRCLEKKITVEELGDDFVARFHNDRLDHDFEFWALQTITINDKETANDVPLICRRPQRKLLKKLEEMRWAGVPIRIILTKARQWGGSTLVQFYMMWLQVRVFTGWNSVIVGDVEKQAKGVRAMYENAINKYPSLLQKLSFKTYQNESSWKQIPERKCTMSIASMQSPDKVRQEDIKLAHLTEVGLWKKTEGKEPKDIVQSILGTIPNKANTLLVMESTAKGVGNYFHQAWLHAINKDSNMAPVFVPWYEIELYQEDFNSDAEAVEFFKGLNEYEQWLWSIGVTIEGIHWYRLKLSEFEGDTWRMQSEFPTTWQEAFQSTGQRAFPPKYVANIETEIKKPIFIGEVFSVNDNGSEETFKDLELIKSPNGKLHLWRMPNDPPVPDDYEMKNRYLVTVDVGGASKTADFSAISIFDRYWMHYGGTPEAIGTWHHRMDADLVSWMSAKVAKIFQDGLLMIEVNFLDKKDNDEGDAYYTVLDEIGPYYDNLFSRTPPEKIKQGAPVQYGFHMNRKTKPEIVHHFKKVLRDGLYTEYDARVSGEAHSYELRNGKYNAVEGQFDDLLVTRMMGVWACYNEEIMNPVELVKVKNVKERKTPVSVAQF